MTGKEFFGKLLSNRQTTPEPWDRKDSEGGLPAVDLDVAPSYEEEEDDAARVLGGDGQSSALPEVRPSNPHPSDADLHVETPAPRDNDDRSLHQPSPTGETAFEQNEREAPVFFGNSFRPSSEGDVDDNDAASNAVSQPSMRRQPEAESPEDVVSQNSGRAALELPVAPLPSSREHDAKGPSPSSGVHEDDKSPAATSYSIGAVRDDDDPPAERASSEGREAESTSRKEAATVNGRQDAAAPTAAPRHLNGAPVDVDASYSAAARQSDTRSEAAQPAAPGRAGIRNAGTANVATNGHQAGAGNAPTKADHAGAPPERARDEKGSAPRNGASTPASVTQAKAAPSKPNNRAGTELNSVSTGPQTSGRSETRMPTSGRDRRESEQVKPRTKAPVAVQGDAELKGIKDRVVIRLLEKKLVSEAHVKAALRERNKDNLKATLWRIVAHQTGVDREAIYREAALTYAFVERKLEEKEVDLEFVRQVADVFPEKRRNRLIELRVVPVGYEFEQQTQMLRVVFLTHDPSLPAVRELMQELNLERYELQYAPEHVVKDLLAKAFPRKNEYLERMSEDPLAYDLGLSYEDEKGELIDEEALEAEINRSSLINLFEAALVESVHKGASDIHIYPNAKRQVEIHFRVDGRLMLWHLEDKVHPESLLAVIKDNTMNVDRFERDMAQDGFIQRKVDDTLIRYRVSILPIATAQQSLHAESIVIRVLDDRKVLTDLSQLGLLKGALERFDMAIRQPHGMVILTGPTGSGKSTTLVAALHQVVNPELNVLTVEDPVEYIIPSVRQIKLNHKLNLEQALRSILRHDPDVVMVGEMRDRPTAELAIKLANTGHLTFSTLHTNDAPSAVSRLYKMGVEPFLIAYAINLVVAQRLIRSLCPTCKVVDRDPDPVLLDRLGFTKDDLNGTTFYTPSGDPTCKTCKGTGYKGRRAISEALYFSRAIRHLVVEADTKIDEDALREAAKKEGMLTLQDSAREVVKMGATSVDEMMRVTATEE